MALRIIAALTAASLASAPTSSVRRRADCPHNPLRVAERHARRMFAGTAPIAQHAWTLQAHLLACQTSRRHRHQVTLYDRRLHRQHATRRLATRVSYGTASYYIDPPGSGNCCGYNSSQGVAVCGSGGGPCVPMRTRIEFTYDGRETVCVADDHGPYVPGRAFDLDQGCAAALGFTGVQTVGYRVL